MNKPSRESRAPASSARRGFIGVALCAPALAAGAAFGRTPAAPEPPPVKPADPPAARGYHVTDHIRTYYSLARF